MEMQFVQWSRLNQAVAESVKKTSTVNKNLVMSLSQQQMDIMGIYMEGSIKQVQSLSKPPRDLQSTLLTQAELLQEFNKKLLNNFRVTFEIMMDARQEMTKLYQKNWQSLQNSGVERKTISLESALVPAPVVSVPVVSVAPAVAAVTEAAQVVVETTQELIPAPTQLETTLDTVVETVEASLVAATVEVEAEATNKTIAEKATSNPRNTPARGRTRKTR